MQREDNQQNYGSTTCPPLSSTGITAFYLQRRGIFTLPPQILDLEYRRRRTAAVVELETLTNFTSGRRGARKYLSSLFYGYGATNSFAHHQLPFHLDNANV